MTTENYSEADSQMDCTNHPSAQYFVLYAEQNPVAWLGFPHHAHVYETTVPAPSPQCSATALVYTEAPLGDPALDLSVGSQSRLEAPEGVHGTLGIGSGVHEENRGMESTKS